MTGAAGIQGQAEGNDNIPVLESLEWVTWLEQAAASTHFGEVGISLVIHEGRIVRVRKTFEEERRIQSRRDGKA